MKVRVMLDVWVSVDADSEAEARVRVARYKHIGELDIEELHAVGEVIEVEDGS